MEPVHHMDNTTRATPVIPLPNPGEGGPVADLGNPPSDGATPVIPLPDLGAGGPVADLGNPPSDGATPVIPLPDLGAGGPVADNTPPLIPLPGFPRAAHTRFLNAAFGYPSFRILVNGRQAVSRLRYGALTGYGHISAGYQAITVAGLDGYIYLQKTLPFETDSPSTVAIINTAGGLDLLQIHDSCCAPAGGVGTLRVSNLARNSSPLDVLLADGRTVFADVSFKQTTAFKRIYPGGYQFLMAQTELEAMPLWQDVETMDSAFIGASPVLDTVATLYLQVRAGVRYTVFLLSGGSARNAVQTLVAADS